MAWTIENFEGVYMGGQPSNARVALFELCRALNQRERAAGLVVTEFYKADGTLTDSITLDDLANIRSTGEDALTWLNLKKIRLGIENLITSSESILGVPYRGVFWTRDRDEYLPIWVWTVAQQTGTTSLAFENYLGIDVGAVEGTTIWRDLAFRHKPQDYRYFEYLRIALDALRYIRVIDVPAVTSGGRLWGSTDTGLENYATDEDAWAARRRYRDPAYSGAGFFWGTLSNRQLQWGIRFHPFPPHGGFVNVGWVCWITDPEVEYTFSIPDVISGVVTTAEIVMEGGGTNGAYEPIASSEVDVNGITEYMTGPVNRITRDVLSEVVPGDPYVVRVVNTMDEGTLPSPKLFSFHVFELRMLVDITGELTDQD